MSVYSLEFHPAAESEMYEAAAWYAERSVLAGQRFGLEIESKVNLILAGPDRWPSFESDTRRVILNAFPYSIIYRVYGNTVEILAVMHQKRLPGYWSNRR